MMPASLLRASLRSIALRWVLAAFLLVAQQGALTHALSHAGGHAHEAVATLHEHSHGHEASDAACSQEHSEGRALSGNCAFDLVYSQVLGGVHAGHAACVSATHDVAPVAPVAQSFSAAIRVPYDTRGPPAIS